MALTKRDIQEIGKVVEEKLDKRFAENDKKWDVKLDKRFAENDKKWDVKLLTSAKGYPGVRYVDN